MNNNFRLPLNERQNQNSNRKVNFRGVKENKNDSNMW